MAQNQIRINSSTILRERFHVSDETISYGVYTSTGTYLGLMEIVQGKLTASSGIDQEEYDQVRQALPQFDFSLWGEER